MPTKINGARSHAKIRRAEVRPAKAALRNFTFTLEADAELVRLKGATGRNMTAILEDLLLQRRQFSATVEAFLEAEAARTRRPRAFIIEAALLAGLKPGRGSALTQ